MQTIKRYLIKIGASPLDAEDIVQESVYKFLLYVDSVEPDKAYSWLFRVALNKYYDLCRKQKRHVTVTVDEQLLVDLQPTPEKLLNEKERQLQFNTILNEMKPLYKHLILLKYELDLSYQEICKVLDMKQGTLKSHLFRARNQFKALYEKGVKQDEG
ncbi:sigma-70 family RNA polymerase sigma factor [Aquibacillus halophilus]|uniref:Sigma-70 family RNA polymerase sigma factor n=2 Tax=Aquibacillus halophilus TaxID=930132 RepID=A0A6A8DEY2_9BACI|nr:sigma-70 family RNA polymerase sigma factor [Aquibacillus halophilus]